MLLPRAMTVAADIRATAEMPSRLLPERGKNRAGHRLDEEARWPSDCTPFWQAIARPPEPFHLQNL